jgi:hypothetical protein
MIKLATAIILLLILLISTILINNLREYDNGYNAAEYNFNYYVITKKNVIRLTLYSVPECSSIRAEKWMIDKKLDHTSLHGSDAKSMWVKLQDYTDLSADSINKRRIINQAYQLVMEADNHVKTTLIITQCKYSSQTDDVVLFAVKEDRLCQIILQRPIAIKLGIKGL